MGIRSAQFFLRPEASGNTRHGEGDQVVQITVGGVGQLKGPGRIEGEWKPTIHIFQKPHEGNKFQKV